jgi:DNA-directed RNA polymerase specialized sigma24 family protein
MVSDLPMARLTATDHGRRPDQAALGQMVTLETARLARGHRPPRGMEREDLAQELALRVWKRMARYHRGPVALVVFVRTAAQQELRQIIRERQGRGPAERRLRLDALDAPDLAHVNSQAGWDAVAGG